MSIENIYPKGADGKPDRSLKPIGWCARVRVYERDPDGSPNELLVSAEKTFRFAKGYRRADAVRWEQHQIAERHQIERDRVQGLLPRRSGPRALRTVEELVELYYQDHSFVKLRASAKERIRYILSGLLRWNAVNGRTYAAHWTAELANKRLVEIWATHKGRGRSLHAHYEKKIFTMEVKRKGLAENPWPTIPEDRVPRSKRPPRVLSPIEIEALLACAEPYARLIFTVLLNTGLRTEELLQLPLSRIVIGSDGRPAELVIESFIEDHGAFIVKNDRDRELALNDAAARAISELTKIRDDSGYLIRRETASKGHPIWTMMNAAKRRAAVRYPELAVAMTDKRQHTKITTHTLRKTFATMLARKGANIKDIADILGDDVNTCYQYYLGIDKESMSEAIMKVSFEPVASPYSAAVEA